MILIGLTGPARCGKDTVAGYLETYHKFHPTSMAAPIRSMIRNLLGGWSMEELEARKEVVIPELGFSPRQLMQTLGTEWGREILDQDFWRNIVQRTISQAQSLWNFNPNFAGVVVFDCRFENEAEMIRDLGGRMWHIARPDCPGVNVHASEAGIDFQQGDWLINNNGTLCDLKKVVKSAIISTEHEINRKELAS